MINHEAAVLADVITALLLSFLVLSCISLKSISFESILLMEVLFIFLRLIVVPRDFTTANCLHPKLEWKKNEQLNCIVLKLLFELGLKIYNEKWKERHAGDT